MNFTSLQFLAFFPLVCLCYHLVPEKWRKWLLLGASYYFYMSWKPLAALLLFVITYVTFFAAGKCQKSETSGWKQKTKAALNEASSDKISSFDREEKKRRIWRNIGVAIPLLALILFKNAAFLLVAGISFYTFQSLSYVLDVYAGRLEAERSFSDYALYVSFFPQLVAGPIERPGNLMPQLKKLSICNGNQARKAAELLTLGYFKKIVIADHFAIYADAIFGAAERGQNLSAWTVVAGAVFFAMQIYGDFSGYSDIARGCALCFGVELMENFHFPYLAENISEFWKCWHISLTSWFTDYVYIPLGGSRRGLVRTCMNIGIVFLLSGIWHGFAGHFIVWGCLHGFFMICHRWMTEKKIGQPQKRAGAIGLPEPAMASVKGSNCLAVSGGKILRQLGTFFLVCMAWIFFRASSCSMALSMIARLGHGWGWEGLVELIEVSGLDAKGAAWILLSLGNLWFLDIDPERKKREYSLFPLVLAILMGFLSLLAADQGNAFIYFQF